MRNVLLLLLILVAAPAAAQTLRDLPRGVTLRVVESDGAMTEGRLSNQIGDTLWLAHDRGALQPLVTAVPLSSIFAVQRRVSDRASSSLLGAVLGGATGAAIGYATKSQGTFATATTVGLDGSTHSTTVTTSEHNLTAVYAALSAVIGGILGAAMPMIASWVPVPVR